MFADDLDTFFAGMDSQTVTVGAESFTAYFDENYLDANPGGPMSISSSSPVLTAKSADVTRLALTRGSMITLKKPGAQEDRAYRIHEVQSAGSGVKLLFLHEGP
jgi:hypothetical protein